MVGAISGHVDGGAVLLRHGATAGRPYLFPAPTSVIPREPFDLPAERAAQGESAGPTARPGNTPTQRGKELCLTKLRM